MQCKICCGNMILLPKDSTNDEIFICEKCSYGNNNMGYEILFIDDKCLINNCDGTSIWQTLEIDGDTVCDKLILKCIYIEWNYQNIRKNIDSLLNLKMFL